MALMGWSFNRCDRSSSYARKRTHSNEIYYYIRYVSVVTDTWLQDAVSRHLHFLLEWVHLLSVKAVCKCLWKVFQPIHMPIPTTLDYQCIAEIFNSIWKFPNCIGAIDGKHVRIKCPSHYGSMYYNYKHYFSIILEAVADDHYKFVCIEVGGYGKQSDGGTFAASDVGRLLNSNKLAIPGNKELPSTNVEVPQILKQMRPTP